MKIGNYSNRKKKEKPMVYTKQVFIPSTDDITEAKETLLKQGYTFTKSEWEIDTVLSSAVLHICFNSIHDNEEVRYSNMFKMEHVTDSDKREMIERISFESLIKPQVRVNGLESEIEFEEELDELRKGAEKDAPTELGQNKTVNKTP